MDFTIAGYTSGLGADIESIEPFTEELTGIVKEMQEKLVDETKMLEGTEMLEREDIVIPPPENPEAVLAQLTGKNELSGDETKDDQWSSASQNGLWTTDPILTSTPESSSSATTASSCSLRCPTRRSNELLSLESTSCCKESLDASGCEIDATSGYCACMVQTISVPTDGTPSEEK